MGNYQTCDIYRNQYDSIHSFDDLLSSCFVGYHKDGVPATIATTATAKAKKSISLDSRFVDLGSTGLHATLTASGLVYSV